LRGSFKTFKLGQDQGSRKLLPQEYTGYFEDYNLSLTLILPKIGRFETGS
jgi:hypothetical protein